MRDAAAFEALLARSLVEHARLVDRPFDPSALALAAARGHRTAAAQAFGRLPLGRRLVLVGLVAMLVMGLAIAGVRLLEPKPFGWGTMLYLLADERPGGDTARGPFLFSAQIGADEAPRLRVALDSASRGLPAGLELESLSPSGRFALLTTHGGLPFEEILGVRVVVDTADGSVDVLPPSLSAVWAPAGERLAWLARGTSGYGITVLEADSGRSREVFATPAVVDHPILWKDQGTIMVDLWQSVRCPIIPVCWTKATWEVPVDGGAPAALEGSGATLSRRGSGPEAAISPDRSLVAYVVEDTSQLGPPAVRRETRITVWVHAYDGSNARTLATFSRPVDGPYAPVGFEQTAWSADTRTFSWAMLGRLWVASADGAELAEFDLAAYLNGAASLSSYALYLP